MSQDDAPTGLDYALAVVPGYRPPTELLTFFYLLVRDALPAGEVVRLVREAKRAKGKEPVFSSEPLAQLARDLLAELAG